MEKKLRIIPLGGLGEIGKNMTVLEYGRDMLVVDCGVMFPDSDLPGIDLVLPGFDYVLKNQDRLRGIVLTHGHMDHIGGLPYLLRQVKTSVYGTALTVGMVKRQLQEAGVLQNARLHVVGEKESLQLGQLKVSLLSWRSRPCDRYARRRRGTHRRLQAGCHADGRPHH
jgi:ribonuclease J